jgi:dienelactone hydrolase
MPAELEGFTSFDHTRDGMTHRVYVTGAAEAAPVLVMHEMPGFAEPAVDFARRLSAEGFQVALPHLFGDFMKRDPLRYYRQLCVSREFANLAAGVSAPITVWLRSLTKRLSTKHQGARVGAIGMCLTGAFVLPLVLDPWVTAPVAAQPAIPFSLTYRLTGLGKGAWASQLNVHDDELRGAGERLRRDGLHLLALRFRDDRISVAEKIDRLRAACGDRLDAHEYPSPARRKPFDPPHAILTEEYLRARDVGPSHPTRQAFAHVVAFLREQLTAG